jgi:hypothetical protein
MKIIITESQYRRLISENFQKQKEMILDLLSDLNFDGVIRYEFSDTEDRNEVTDIFVVFDVNWEPFDKEDPLFYVRRDRLAIKIKMEIKNFIKKYLGLEHIYIGTYFE